MAEKAEVEASFVERIFLKVSPFGKYWGFRLASRLSGIVPLKISYAIATGVGDFIYYTWRDHSAHAISNMLRVLGHGTSLREAKRMARKSFRQYAKTLVDFIRFPHVGKAEIISRVKTGGWEILEEARAEGKGVLVVSGHIGNWDFGGAVLGMHGLVMHAIADTLEPPQLNELVRSTRERNGMHILPLGTAALRSMLQALKRNEMVLLLMDRPMPADEGIEVTFFGERAYLPSGPAAIALKSGASLVTGALVRLPGDRMFSGAWEPIRYRQLITGDKEADIQAISQQVATALEQVIARNPDQWYMFRPMWPRLDISRRAARLEAATKSMPPAAQAAGNGREAAAGDGRGGLRRLRDRLRRRASGRIDVAALGISVDPPEMESWARGAYEEPGSAPDEPAGETRPARRIPRLWPFRAGAAGRNGNGAAAGSGDSAGRKPRSSGRARRDRRIVK